MAPYQGGGSVLRGMKRMSGHQPQFLPSIDYFVKIGLSEHFVYSDDVLFTPREWQNRNRIFTGDSWQWLTVPVHASSSTRIHEVKVASDWQAAMVRQIRFHLGHKPFYDLQVASLVDMIGGTPDNSLLVDLQIKTLQWVLDLFQINTTLVRAYEQWGVSPLPVSQKLRMQMDSLGCAFYLSGPSGPDYLDPSPFEEGSVQIFTFTERRPSWRCSIIQLLAEWMASALYPVPPEIGHYHIDTWK